MMETSIKITIGDWHHTLSWPSDNYADAIRQLKSILAEDTILTDVIDEIDENASIIRKAGVDA
jgi:hypothetical protein